MNYFHTLLIFSITFMFCSIAAFAQDSNGLNVGATSEFMLGLSKPGSLFLSPSKQIILDQSGKVVGAITEKSFIGPKPKMGILTGDSLKKYLSDQIPKRCRVSNIECITGCLGLKNCPLTPFVSDGPINVLTTEKNTTVDGCKKTNCRTTDITYPCPTPKEPRKECKKSKLVCDWVCDDDKKAKGLGVPQDLTIITLPQDVYGIQ